MFRNTIKSFFLFVLTAVCILGASGSLVYAQSNKGSIIGTVTDPSGAVIPNAKVIVTNNATKEPVEITSNDSGEFAVTNLDPGVYSVRAEAAGFKAVLLTTVTVETAARVPLDVKFTEIAGTGDNTVTITTDSAPLVESETSVRGDLITGRQVTDLPIPQRNFTLLAGLSPGVTRPSSGSVGVLGSSNLAEGSSGLNESTESTRFRESGGSSISSNGARPTQNEFLLDGVDNNESQFRQIAIYPNPDAIAEFKIETSVPSAEFGRAGGAVISTTFKSGTNLLHGSAFEFYQGRFASASSGRFDEFNSRPNAQGFRLQPRNYVSHNFGGTIGGPVFLPAPGINGRDKFWYDGRNRTFFFFSYAGQRRAEPLSDNNGDPSFVTVPTAQMRLGNFTELLRGGTREYTFPSSYTNPTGAQCRINPNNPNQRLCTFPTGTIFSPQGIPIPGNDLRNCPTCGGFSQFGLSLLRAFPLPTENRTFENYRVNRQTTSDQDGYDIRLDHKIFEGNTIFGRYSKLKLMRARSNNFPLGTSPNGNDLPSGFGAGAEFGNTRAIALGDTQTFGTNIVNDFRFGYTRVEIGINNTGVFGEGGFSPNVSANLGASNINLDPTSSGIILLGLVDTYNGDDRAAEFVGDGGPFFFRSDNFNYADAVTIVRGNHIIKGGADIRVRQNRNFDGGRNGGIKGNYQYGTTDSGFASGGYNGIGSNDTGSALANFLLGYQPGFVGRGTPGSPTLLTSKEIAFFVQDDWKATSDLTLNLGLRYDLYTAPTERFDRQSNFDPATGRITVAGDSAPNGRDLINNDKNNFGPRIGFAYSFGADKQIVLRGGYGVVYSVDASGIQPLTTNPGTGAGSFNCQPIINPSGCPAGYPLGRNPFERGIPFVSGSVAAPGSSFAAPTDRDILYVNPERKDALFHQYNLTLQYGFWRDWLAEIAYVGSTGRNLLIVRNIGNSNEAGAPGSRQVTNIQNVITTDYLGEFNYNALQSKIEKRFAEGLSILSTYTFSKTIDNTPGGFCQSGAGQRNCGPDNPLDINLDRSLSDLDVRHRFTLASVYDLPIGKGRKFFSDMPAALEYVIGGWQLNNLITLQSGPVYTVTANGGRVDIIGDPTPTAQQLAQGIQLNRAAFRVPTRRVFPNDPNSPVFGNLGRNTFRGDFQEFWDASLFKNIPLRFLGEEGRAEIRVSAFNVWNHVNRGAPNGDFFNGNFGKDTTEQRRRQLEFGLRIVF